MKKIGWGFLTFLCVGLACSGFEAFSRSVDSGTGNVYGNLILAVIFTVLSILCVKKILTPRRSKSFPSAPLVPIDVSQYDSLFKVAAGAVFSANEASVGVIQRKLKIGYTRAKLLFDELQSAGVIGPGSTHAKILVTPEEFSKAILPPGGEPPPTVAFQKTENPISIRTARIDPDEGLETPAWAELSYLDAQALKFWNGKTTGFVIPDYYAGTAFGRNVGPARDRLLKDGYLHRGDIRKSIERKTIPDLKAVLADKELKTSGKKGELVQRLLDNIPPDELEELFPEGVYEMTEKGGRALDQYGIVFENQGYGLGFSYYRLMDAKGRNPREEDAVILSRLLAEDIEACCQSGDRSRYQELLTKGARFMDGNGEPLKALEFSILAYFIWAMESKALSLPGVEGQNYYLSRHVEEYARRCDLTFDQLLEHFAVTVRENKPFALSSEANIRYALDMLRQGLSIHQ